MLSKFSILIIFVTITTRPFVCLSVHRSKRARSRSKKRREKKLFPTACCGAKTNIASVANFIPYYIHLCPFIASLNFHFIQQIDVVRCVVCVLAADVVAAAVAKYLQFYIFSCMRVQRSVVCVAYIIVNSQKKYLYI